ncbi:MAG: hypothetical protein AAF846_23195 [Chloroflexota bacterium]
MSYQLYCPNCSQAIAHEDINVQKTIAACANCGAVFNFSDKVGTTPKVKRRKTKKPDYISQTETADRLALEMPLLQTMSNKVGWGVLTAMLLGLYSLLAIGTLSDGDIGPFVVFSLLFVPMILGMLASQFTKQSIEVNAEELKHEVRFGLPIYQRKVDVADIKDVMTEEMLATQQSVAKARYNLFAERHDGRQDMFVQNIPEETALYAQQVLSGYFNADDANVSLRLQDDIGDDEMLNIDEQEQQQRQSMG